MKRILLLLILALASAPAFARPAVLSLTVDHGIPLSLNGSASSVFIANPDIADVQVMSPSQIMIFGKRTGETTFMATDSKGNALAERTVVVSQDLSELRQELSAAIPGHGIKAKPVPGGIILTGTAKDQVSVADAYKIAMRFLPAGGDIINRIQVSGSNQVQIRVRFAEVQRNIDNTLGFNWRNLGTIGSNFTVGLATGASGLGTGSNILSSRPSNTALNMPNNVLGASYHSGNVSVDGIIDALAQEGLVSILAEPNLTAMSGETASFLAGGEFPIPIPQGNGTISVTFKDYGISLAFTPTLLSGNRISLHVRPEVSQLSETGSIVLDNITVPALVTRKAETTVEVASGESFAIAGLMDNSQSQTINKFPMLGDMPVLGALFRSDHFQNNQTELVVIITPYVVKPSGQRLALPTDGLAAPTEGERFIGLRTTSGDPSMRPISGDPVGVAVPAAPVAAPVSPVSVVPSTVKSEAAPVVSSKQELAPSKQEAVVLKKEVVSSKKEVVAPVKHVAAPPLVLHPSGDAGKRGGGLLVE